MISEVDIRDWLEDKKTLPKNHAGWEVQAFVAKKGWLRVSLVYPDRDKAIKCCLVLQQYWKGCEFRVYESLKE